MRMVQSLLFMSLMLFSYMIEAKSQKIPDISRFKFHKVSPSELPTNNLVGNMNEIIRALNYQIKNCTENQGKSQTVTIANLQFKRQQWCLDTNQKMLILAKSANGNFKTFLSSIKNQFDWYKSDGWPEKHGKFKKGDIKFTAYYSTTSKKNIAYGSENNPLTPHASCATDHRIIPVGMIFIYSYNKITSWCIAQDSGSAVKGAHVDLYKGQGAEAGAEVRNLYFAGSLFLALPKPIILPVGRKL